jgi:hypothetical protein
MNNLTFRDKDLVVVIAYFAALIEKRVSGKEGYGKVVKWSVDLFMHSRSTRAYHRRDDMVVRVLD